MQTFTGALQLHPHSPELHHDPPQRCLIDIPKHLIYIFHCILSLKNTRTLLSISLQRFPAHGSPSRHDPLYELRTSGFYAAIYGYVWHRRRGARYGCKIWIQSPLLTTIQASRWMRLRRQQAREPGYCLHQTQSSRQ